MQIKLLRTYYAEGTNGIITHAGVQLCHTIELPWRDNATGISCIAEGSYMLAKRYSAKFQWHLQVMAVPNRDLILIHAANNALLELKGCIAPVTAITGCGTGTASCAALMVIQALIFPALDKGERVILVVGKGEMVDRPPSIDDR